MRAVLQRVHRAACVVEGEVTGEIGPGLLVFLGVERDDTENDLVWITDKITAIRIFPDEAGKMNRSVRDIDGGVLLISQFTLFGTLAKGTRPSFYRAAPPDLARALYENAATRLTELLGAPTATGLFGAHMDIEAHQDGPVTILLDSRNKDL